MPQDQHFARLLGTKRLTYISRPGRSPFQIQTLNKFLIVWEVMVKNEIVAEQIRQKLQKRHNFNIDEAFRATDTGKDGVITV